MQKVMAGVVMSFVLGVAAEGWADGYLRNEEILKSIADKTIVEWNNPEEALLHSPPFCVHIVTYFDGNGVAWTYQRYIKSAKWTRWAYHVGNGDLCLASDDIAICKRLRREPDNTLTMVYEYDGEVPILAPIVEIYEGDTEMERYLNKRPPRTNVPAPPGRSRVEELIAQYEARKSSRMSVKQDELESPTKDTPTLSAFMQVEGLSVRAWQSTATNCPVESEKAKRWLQKVLGDYSIYDENSRWVIAVEIKTIAISGQKSYTCIGGLHTSIRKRDDNGGWIVLMEDLQLAEGPAEGFIGMWVPGLQNFVDDTAYALATARNCVERGIRPRRCGRVDADDEVPARPPVDVCYR